MTVCSPDTVRGVLLLARRHRRAAPRAALATITYPRPRLSAPPLKDNPPTIPTADSASGCEGQAPEGPKGPADHVHAPLNAGQSRTPINLDSVASEMEKTAAAWRSPVAVGEAVRAFEREAQASGKVWCRCGGGAGGGLVPEFFGRNCIEPRCPLRVSA